MAWQWPGAEYIHHKTPWSGCLAAAKVELATKYPTGILHQTARRNRTTLSMDIAQYPEENLTIVYQMHWSVDNLEAP